MIKYDEPLCTICLSAQANFDLSERMLCNDCRTLLDTAIRALSIARQDGCVKQGYDPSSWIEVKDRLEHATTHIQHYVQDGRSTSEDHLAHAICDLVMVYAQRS